MRYVALAVILMSTQQRRLAAATVSLDPPVETLAAEPAPSR